MSEAAEIARIATPAETLLVADSLTGQDAVRTATAFHERLPLTGLILTRADGDGRGGAALSMRAVTGLPIKFLGVSEKIDGLDAFDARRVAGRILGQGDVVALVERAAQDMDVAKAEALAKRLAKGPVVFHLKAQLANEGDQTKDPSQPWPDDRKVVELGTLTLNKAVADSMDAQKKLLFMPTNLTDGIELSDDQLPQIRAGAYAVSFGRRQK